MSRRKNNIQSDYTMDDLADSLLSRILACVDQKAQSNDITKGAIVTRVNEDGTVNVKLPADEEGHEFTKISNQSVYELSVGDSVELYLKGGRYSNCWIIAKHGMGRKRVALETQKGNTVVVGGGSSTGGGSGTIPESILKHLVDYNNPHRVTKEQLGLSKVVTSINGESGDVTIPTVINDAKLTIQQNGTEVGNFTANSAVDKTVNITVPTKLSELENNSSFATTDELPTKTSQLTNDSGYITSADIPNIPVTTVNGKTGAVQLTATDVGALPDTTTIPTKTSQLSNDSGYITFADIPNIPVQSVNGKTGVIELTAKDVGALPNTTTIPTKISQLSNDNGYITSAEAPVQSVNGKSGAVELTSSDVGALPTSGGTLTGNLKVGSANIQTNGYIVGTWLQGTTPNHLTTAATKIAVQDGSGWVYHRTAKEIKSDIGLGNVDNVKQYSASNPPPYPVTSVNGKVGTIELAAADVGAIATDNISQTLGNSNTKVPSEKAVVDAMSAAGYGDMLKARYANNDTDDTVDKAFSDANGKNIADTYVPKDGGTLNNVNANTLITTGNYLIGEGCTNFPDGSQGSVVQVVGAGGSAYQTTVIYATNTYAHRAYNGTTWTAWKDANGAVVSATQPQYQNVGSLWFKEIT